jgi:hypothetical protein
MLTDKLEIAVPTEDLRHNDPLTTGLLYQASRAGRFIAGLRILVAPRWVKGMDQQAGDGVETGKRILDPCRPPH